MGIKAFPITSTYKKLYKSLSRRYTRHKMPEPLTEEVKEQFNIIFSGKFVKVKRGEHTEGTKLYLTISDADKKVEVSHTYTYPENFEFTDILDGILQLRNVFDIPDLLSNDKLVDEVRKEILKLIGLLVWKII